MEVFIQRLTISARDQLKIDVIYKLDKNKMDFQEAALVLGVSMRTIKRYLKKYREKGVVFVQHGNKGKPCRNQLPVKLKEKVQQLVR